MIQKLIEKGVQIIDPRQVYIAPEVDPERIYPGCVLYPGTRLTGSRTLIGSGAKIGTEGPAMIQDTVIGANAVVASGYLAESTLLPEANVGANAHFRAGTLLEETATTAHCVGLKQSILMYSVTLGSLINCCDILISGGRSRNEHSEVGSGFIHFNFTPYGVNGDKATASLIGTVTEGVFLDQKKIFLGGMSGVVGPVSVGFGAMTVAGQVVRHSVEAETMSAEADFDLKKNWSPTEVTFSEKRLNGIKEKNIEYLVQLYALKLWYEQVRMRRSVLQKDTELSLVYAGAVETIEACIKERIKRYNRFAQEWNLPLVQAISEAEQMAERVWVVDWKSDLRYDEWVWQLTDAEKVQLHSCLSGYADAIRKQLWEMLQKRVDKTEHMY